MAKRNLPDDTGTDPAAMDGGEGKEQQEDWGELYQLDATESYSTDEFSDSSYEDEFDFDNRYLRVEIQNEGESNKNKVNFFPKTGMRRFNSSALLKQNIGNDITTEEENIARAESAPTLLSSSSGGGLPAFLANRIRNAELVVGSIASACDANINSLQKTAAKPIVGPATKALEQEDPRIVYSQILEKHGVCSVVQKGEEL
eukprot:jgi/Psemu1/300437/fgenesh1_kg.12_\